ncbi:MAG: phosphoglycerate kinase [bacterium]|nr:phosphoglycerate kinase [bacterium]
MIKKIQELENLEGLRVFLRVDYNVPIENGKVVDRTRINETLKTISYLRAKGAKIIIASHLGRPKGIDIKYSLKPIKDVLSELISDEVIFPGKIIGEDVVKLSMQLKPSAVMLIENLRFDLREEKNSQEFAKELLQLFDGVFIQEAFGAVHRAHTSTHALPLLSKVKAAGFLLQKEIEFLSKIREYPTRPFVCILGGAKISDKLKVIEELLKIADKILIGGAMAFTFLKNEKKIGKSLYEEELVEKMQELKKNEKIILPEDFIAVDDIESPKKIVEVEEIPNELMGVDIGTKSRKIFKEALKDAKTIFFNGPLGVYEKAEFIKGTKEILEFVSNLDAIKVAGGGDAVAAINMLKLNDKFTHISTGGGASMEFIEGRELPGIKALQI